jgi:hypothetical protein
LRKKTPRARVLLPGWWLWRYLFVILLSGHRGRDRVRPVQPFAKIDIGAAP